MTALRPVHYTLHLEPDLETFAFSGTAEIVLESEDVQSDMVLNGAQISIRSCRLLNESGEHPAEFSQPDPDKQTFRIRFPETVTGRFSLRIEYTGSINDSMMGFYRSAYTDASGRKKYIAVTQFEEAEARKAFPCLDEPAMKATFDVEYVIDAGLTAVSNMPVEHEAALPGGKKRVRFERTPVMSTYLLFFGVGEFDILEDKGRVLLRAITTPGKVHLAEQGLRFARKCLDYLEKEFGTPYPLPKLDLIALPDFAFGAMENWGAMTFRENLLLVYPGITSQKALQSLYTVIAHEMVHQWFGDLVSPAEWKYLWLNESFATVYGNIAVDHVYPEWGTMDSYVLESTASAFGRDSLQRTIPVELDKEAKITASTAPIIYEKGGAVLWMAFSFLGKTIQAGLSEYFHKFAYGVTTSPDLWKTLESSSGQRGVAAMMENWVRQPGYPEVHVRVKGDRIIFEQKRFTYIRNDDAKEKWIIPLTVFFQSRTGKMFIRKYLMEDSCFEGETPQGVVMFKVNVGQTGFYRVRYEQEDLNRLGELVREQIVGGADRYGIQDDLFAFVRSGAASAENYLRFVEAFYEKETHHLPLRGMMGSLSLLGMVLEGNRLLDAVALGRRTAERILEKIGYAPLEHDDLNTAALRSILLWNAVQFDSGKAREFLMERFDTAEKGASLPHPDIADAVYRTAAFTEPKAFESLTARFLASESEQERMILAAALGCVGKERLQEAVRFALDNVPPRLRFVPFVMMAGNSKLMGELWGMFLANRKALETLPAFHFERVLASVITVGGLFTNDDVREFLDSYKPESMKSYLPYLKQTVDMALEKLEALKQLRGRESADQSSRLEC